MLPHKTQLAPKYQLKGRCSLGSETLLRSCQGSCGLHSARRICIERLRGVSAQHKCLLGYMSSSLQLW
jgi:hypothetical protein